MKSIEAIYTRGSILQLFDHMPMVFHVKCVTLIQGWATWKCMEDLIRTILQPDYANRYNPTLYGAPYKMNSVKVCLSTLLNYYNGRDFYLPKEIVDFIHE